MRRARVRGTIALALIAAASAVHYVGTDSALVGLPLWFGLAVAAGLAWPRRWLIAAAPLPWLLGVGGGLLTGRYVDLGEGWVVVLLTSAAVGAAGIALGSGLARRRSE